MDVQGILAELRKERDRLDQAISALQGMGSRRGRKPGVPVSNGRKRRGGGITAAGRKRLSEAMKRRWAERKRKGA